MHIIEEIRREGDLASYGAGYQDSNAMYESHFKKGVALIEGAIQDPKVNKPRLHSEAAQFVHYAKNPEMEKVVANVKKWYEDNEELGWEYAKSRKGKKSRAWDHRPLSLNENN